MKTKLLLIFTAALVTAIAADTLTNVTSKKKIAAFIVYGATNQPDRIFRNLDMIESNFDAMNKQCGVISNALYSCMSENTRLRRHVAILREYVASHTNDDWPADVLALRALEETR